LVSTKRPHLEAEDELVARINEATAYVPKEKLSLSTQCGFASVAGGNNLSLEEQERKLELVALVTRHIWVDA
jgi:methionine synthase II (cobalamin-independent)